MGQFSLANQTNLFKINYYKVSENTYNSANVMLGRVKKLYNFVGKQKFVAIPTSFAGGVGAKLLPKSNSAEYEGAVITAKKVYATTKIEREAIKASANDKGAFVRATKESVQKAVESFNRFASFLLFGDGTGVLGNGGGSTVNVTGTGAEVTPYIVEIGAASWKEANWEERDFVQMVVAGAPEGGDSVTNLLEIVDVDPATKKISLVGVSTRLTALTGVGPMVVTDEIAMQRSYNAVPQGLKGISDLSIAGSPIYGVPAGRRWKMVTTDAGAAGVTVDLINGLTLEIERKTGKCPKMLLTSYAQYQTILSLLEDQKVYNLPARYLKGQMSFEGVEFMTPKGKIGLFVDRFCEDDRLYALNDDFIEVHHRPGFGWFDDDGTVFLRTTDEDSYDARYGGYYENYIVPTFQGVLYNLAV